MTAKRDKVRHAVDLYEKFSGHEPEYLDTHEMRDYDVGVHIGQLSGVMYETVRDGKREKYFHRFNEKSRPELASSWNGEQLMIVGGEYDFTDEGIKDRRGKEAMAEEILLVNPRKRRRRKTSTKRKTTAKRAAPKRRRSPVRRRRRVTRAKRNPARRGVMGMAQQSFMPAVQGSAGAIGLDLLLGYAPLPPALQSGMARHLVKGVGAIALGGVAGMIGSKSMARNMTQGALTVALHGAAREMMQTAMPDIKLGMTDYDMGYVSSGYVPNYGNDTPAALTDQSDMGEYLSGMGEYLSEYEMDYGETY